MADAMKMIIFVQEITRLCHLTQTLIPRIHALKEFSYADFAVPSHCVQSKTMLESSLFMLILPCQASVPCQIQCC